MRLTRAEEEIMQILWKMEEGIVKQIRDEFPEPRPARNTVSTIVRILEKKGYIGHRSYGNVHVYYPVISKEEYSKSQLFGLMESYFNNSFSTLASFFAKEKNLSINDLDRILNESFEEIKKSRKKK